jgi:hypothetical protein
MPKGMFLKVYCPMQMNQKIHERLRQQLLMV